MITVTEEYVYYHSCLEKIIKQWKHAGIPLILRKIKVHYRNLYDDVTWSVEVLMKNREKEEKAKFIGMKWIWAMAWDFQQCGMCDQKKAPTSLRTRADWSEPLSVACIFYDC